MGIHYIVLAIIVAVLLLVLVMQILSRREFSSVLVDLQVLMPAGLEYYQDKEQDETLVGSPFEEESHEDLIGDINSYLTANRGVSPNFSIVKDIVERRGAVLDESLRSLQPMPLYYGLCGTIAGIILGLIPLARDAWGQAEENLTSGVSPLLIGVAVAMLGSLLGIFLTTKNSNDYKEAVNLHEEGKHEFYSWFQVNMLPHLGDGMAGPITQLASTLAQFNQEFKDSAGVMLQTAGAIGNTFAEQRELLDLMRELNSGGLAAQNAQMAQAMVGHIDVVRSFTNSIVGLEAYVTKLREITDKLQNSTEFIPAISALTSILYAQEGAIGNAVAEQARNVQRTIAAQDKASQYSIDQLKSAMEATMSAFHREQAELNDKLLDQIEKHQSVPDALTEMAKVPAVLSELTSAINALSNTQAQQIKLTQGLSDRLERVEKKLSDGPRGRRVEPVPPPLVPIQSLQPLPEEEPGGIEEGPRKKGIGSTIISLLRKIPLFRKKS